MTNREAIDKLKFLHQKLYNGIFKNKTGCFDYAIKALEELEAYHKAEEQGLLLRLPCKVGEWLYYPCPIYKVVVPIRVNEVIISFLGIDNFCYLYNCLSFDGCGDVYEEYEFENDAIGKDIFLTKEEAEEALQKMREKGDE